MISIVTTVLSTVPAAAQETYDELPPEGKHIVDALVAIEEWGNPTDWKGYTVTVIWAMDAYRLLDTEGVPWEPLWHDLIAWENGWIDTAVIEDYGAPDRAGRCEVLRVQKGRYAVAAGVMTNSAVWWRGIGWMIPPTTPFLGDIKWRAELVGHLSAIFAAQLGMIAAMHPTCDTV